MRSRSMVGLLSLLLVGAGLGVAWWLWPNDTLPLQGAPAPNFQLKDQAGHVHRLSDYRGHWLVLYFYPRDQTAECTKEACHFRDDQSRLAALGAEVVGVSLDDGAAHRAFAAKYHLPFTLLSDPGGTTAAAYGSLFSLGPIKFAKRRTFLIDPDGRIARVYTKVNPVAQANQIVTALHTFASREHHPRS